MPSSNNDAMLDSVAPDSVLAAAGSVHARSFAPLLTAEVYLAAFGHGTARRQKATRLVLVALGAALMTASFAAADDRAQAQLPSPPPAIASTAPAVAASTPAQPATSDFAAQVTAQLAALMPAGMRVQSVALGCNPPAGATLDSVAPGVGRLESRGFVVGFRVNGRPFACSATANAERQVMAAAHDIEAGQPVSEHDFETRWVDAFDNAPGSLTEFPQQGPYVSATLIRAGQPLYARELTRPVVVHPGDQVMVLVKNGPVTVRTQLEAQSAAAVGETASMMNPASGTPVMVTVTGPKMAELVMQ